jgi:hypothetical protein
MRHQKPLAVRIFIRICVVFMALSLIWVYVVYMFSPQQEAWEDTEWGNIWDIPALTWDVEIVDEILPEVNPDEPEQSAAPILVTEDGEIDEMDRTFEVQLENGETEIVRQWDLWDAIQITQ